MAMLINPNFFSGTVPPTKIADLIIAAANTIGMMMLVYFALFDVMIITTTAVDFSGTPAIMCGKALNWRNNDTGRIERMGG